MSMDAELVAQIRQKDSERNNVIDEIQKIEEYIEDKLIGAASISIIDTKSIDYIHCDLSIHVEPNKVTRIEQGKPLVAQFLIKEQDTDILIAFTQVTASPSATSSTEAATVTIEHKEANQIEIGVTELESKQQPQASEPEPLPVLATERELEPVQEANPVTDTAETESEIVVESSSENSYIHIKQKEIEDDVTESDPMPEGTVTESLATTAVAQVVYSCRLSCQDLPSESYLIRDLEAVGSDGSVAVITVKASLESFVLQLKSKQLEAEQLTKSIESLKAASKQQLTISKAKKDMKRASTGGNSKVTKKGKSLNSTVNTRGSKERSATRPSAYGDKSVVEGENKGLLPSWQSVKVATVNTCNFLFVNRAYIIFPVFCAGIVMYGDVLSV